MRKNSTVTGQHSEFGMMEAESEPYWKRAFEDDNSIISGCNINQSGTAGKNSSLPFR